MTIAEVEEIVPVGELKPDEIHVPGIYVQRIIKGTFNKTYYSYYSYIKICN